MLFISPQKLFSFSRYSFFFDDKKINKSNFYNRCNKIDAIDVNKILVSKKEPYGTKCSFK